MLVSGQNAEEAGWATLRILSMKHAVPGLWTIPINFHLVWLLKRSLLPCLVGFASKFSCHIFNQSLLVWFCQSSVKYLSFHSYFPVYSLWIFCLLFTLLLILAFSLCVFDDKLITPAMYTLELFSLLLYKSPLSFSMQQPRCSFRALLNSRVNRIVIVCSLHPCRAISKCVYEVCYVPMCGCIKIRIWQARRRWHEFRQWYLL